MNPMADAFKKARMKGKEGSPREEAGESKKEEKKEQAKGVGDRAPVVEDRMGDAPGGMPHDSGSALHGHGADSILEAIKKLLEQHKPEQMAGPKNFDSITGPLMHDLVSKHKKI